MTVVLSRLARIGCTGLGLAMVLTALAGSVHGGAPGISAPEIDPGSMASALTLMLGGALLLTGKSRKN
jgi:hypothetical protein